MIRNQGRDTTIEPAYLSEQESRMNEFWYELLLRLIQELQVEVDGTEDQEFKDGLMYRVKTLEKLVDELIIISDLKIYYDTTANWDAQPSLLPSAGSIYIYSDAKTYEGVPLPRIKIGTGNAYLKDLMFIDEDIVQAIRNATFVTVEEKERWNNKVTVYLNEDDPENVIFTKDWAGE